MKTQKRISDLLRLYVLSAVIMVGFLPALAQTEPAVAFEEYKGVITDAKSGKALEFATISVSNSNISTVSNIEGFFILKVPTNLSGERVTISYLGYENVEIPLSDFGSGERKIKMNESFEKLPDVNLVDVNAQGVVRRLLENRRLNLNRDALIVKAFYRESIKKRRTYASLSEAVIDIYKQEGNQFQRDYVKLDRARKSTDYRKIDTLVIKLQGGPYNNLGMDMMRNQDLFFSEEMFDIYQFSFDKVISIDAHNVYVIDFIQRTNIIEPFYQGKLYIDTKNYALVKAVFRINDENLVKAKKFFVKKKPVNADVIPIDSHYVVDYRNNDGKWYYSYGRIDLSFKVKWDKKLFNSIYHIGIEMAVTDWVDNDQNLSIRGKERLRRNVILTDKARGFSDPSFWGEHNVIEPDKSIHNAIKKIQRSNKREQS